MESVFTHLRQHNLDFLLHWLLESAPSMPCAFLEESNSCVGKSSYIALLPWVNWKLLHWSIYSVGLIKVWYGEYCVLSLRAQ